MFNNPAWRGLGVARGSKQSESDDNSCDVLKRAICDKNELEYYSCVNMLRLLVQIFARHFN